MGEEQDTDLIAATGTLSFFSPYASSYSPRFAQYTPLTYQTPSYTVTPPTLLSGVAYRTGYDTSAMSGPTLAPSPARTAVPAPNHTAAAIGGGGVGGGLALILLALLGWFFWRRHKKQKTRRKDSENQEKSSAQDTAAVQHGPYEMAASPVVSEMAPGHLSHELSGQSPPPELSSTFLHGRSSTRSTRTDIQELVSPAE